MPRIPIQTFWKTLGAIAIASGGVDYALNKRDIYSKGVIGAGSIMIGGGFIENPKARLAAVGIGTALIMLSVFGGLANRNK